MRDFIYSLMTDKIKGPAFAAFKILLYLVSLVYGLVVILRRIFYRFGILKTNRVPMKVISVGNLTLGGTGKTPFVITLANTLKEEFKKEVSVLIRGYGWDEQAMLKTNLDRNAIPVLVGENRVKSSRRAIKLYGSDTVLLDDGFQYWELERDLDIILVDSRKPFGNGRLFPRGILREPKGAVKRADIVVFTKVNKKIFDLDSIKEDLKRMKGDLVFLEAIHRPKYIYDFKTKKKFDLKHIAGKRVILLSSIGDPGYFEETVMDLGADIAAHIKFGDHHNYSEKDIEKIMQVCDEKKFDFLITTEKDAVKLNRLRLSAGNYTLLTLAVEMDITIGKGSLVARLHSLYNNSVPK